MLLPATWLGCSRCSMRLTRTMTINHLAKILPSASVRREVSGISLPTTGKGRTDVEHFKDSEPEDFHVLSNTKVVGGSPSKKTVSLWQHIQSFKNAFIEGEKLLLLDRRVASHIADKIAGMFLICPANFYGFLSDTSLLLIHCICSLKYKFSSLVAFFDAWA